MSRITNDVSIVQNSIKSFIDLFKEIITVIVLATVILVQNMSLALYAVLVIPFVVYPIIKIGKTIKKYSKKSQEQMGDLSSILQETFSGVKVVKSFVMEKNEIKKFNEENKKFTKSLTKIAFLNNLNSPIMDILAGVSTRLIVLYEG